MARFLVCNQTRGEEKRGEMIRGGVGVDSDKPRRLVDWLYDDGCHVKRGVLRFRCIELLVLHLANNGMAFHPPTVRDDWSVFILIPKGCCCFLSLSWENFFKGDFQVEENDYFLLWLVFGAWIDRRFDRVWLDREYNFSYILFFLFYF